MPLTKTTAFLGLVLFFFFAGFSKVYAGRYGRVVSFGDSLSDRGNYPTYYITRTGKKKSPLEAVSNSGCIGGRASNGLLWCEQLFDPQQRNDNFAFVSAVSGREFSTLDSMLTADIPGFDFQIDLALYGSHEEIWKKIEKFEKKIGDSFEEKMKKGIHVNQRTFQQDFLGELFDSLKAGKESRRFKADELISIWVGMNDLRALRYDENGKFRPLGAISVEEVKDCVQSTINKIHNGINRLVKAGAKNFVILGLPTIFQKNYYPKDPAKDLEDCKSQKDAVLLFNHKLWQELQIVSQENPDITIIPINVEALGELILSGHYDFGIYNRDHRRPCREGDNTTVKQIKENPNTSLFWDYHGHLTATGNRVLADYIRMLIMAPYTVIPQMRASEQGASQAGRNVTNRLFHLRGGLDLHARSASSLVSTSFTPEAHNLNVPLDGQAVFLNSFRTKKNFVSNTNIDPLEDQKLNAIPHIDMDREQGCEKLGVFIAGDYYYGTRSDLEDVAGFKHTSKTITLGGDYRFTPWYLAGVAMSYTKGKTKLHENRGKLELDGYTVTLYNSFKQCGFYLDTSVAYGWNQLDVHRHVPQFFTATKANPLGTHWGASALLGYDLVLNGFRVGPTAGINYGKTKVTSYREDGGLIFNMIVHEQNTTTSVRSLGAHASYDWELCDGVLTPTIRGSYDHELKNRSRVLVTELANMRGIPHRLPVPSNDNDYFRIGGGLSWFANQNYSFSFDYETIVAKKHSRDHFLFVKFRQLM